MNDKILVIDDMPINVRLLKEILEDEGYQVYCLNERINETYIERINELMPSLIFLDIMMPEISGYEVCSKIKKHPILNNIPVIMLSAMYDFDTVKKVYEAGANGFLSKPFSENQLISMVKSFMNSNQDNLPTKQKNYKVEVCNYDQVLINYEPDTVLKKFNNDITFFIEMVCSFEKSTQKILSEINEIIITTNEVGFKQALHSLKNLMVMFNAYSALAILARLETYSVNIHTGIIEMELNNLIKEINHVVQSLRDFMQDEKSWN